MVSRRPHKKSRLGCATCKSRRVKCDEGGPPCGPCSNKGIECKYADAKLLKRPSPAARDYATPPSSNAAFSEWTSSRRMLELELLHQWTTVTHQNYCASMESEWPNWQIVVPKIALKHECLLHGIFAMSALEIVALDRNGTSQDYVYHALHYQNLASGQLREELSKTDLTTAAQDKFQALWASSSILMAIALALPPLIVQEGSKYNMVDHIMTFTELARGLVIIVSSKIKSVKEDPLLCNYKEWDELEGNPIDLNWRGALDRLVELNEETHGAGRTDRQISELEAMNYHAACRRAIFYLEEVCSKCSEPDTRSYGLIWTLLSGKEYLTAVKNMEPVALVILMHWAVLLEKQSYGVWYAERVGRHLVLDLSDEISVLVNEKLKDAVNWTREQVGLDIVSSANT